MSLVAKKRREERRINHVIACRLRARRDELGFSDDKVAALLGITPRQYRRYEAHEACIPTSRLCLLARVLFVRTGWFFEGL